MKRRQAEAVLNRFLEECGDAVPTQGDIEPVLDRVWQRLEWKADEFVGARVPAAPTRLFRFGLAAAIVLVAAVVNGLLWRNVSVSVKTGNAGDHSLLRSTEQAGETLQLTASQDVFEVASVKLLSPTSEAARLANMGETMQSALRGCPGGYAYTTQLDPGRLTIPGASVLSLVMLAYGYDCTLVDGGPAWARSGEYYEIRALLPEGTPRETILDFLKGDAPRLQRMLQNLLADRFHLVLKRELREMPVYALTVASPGKMKLSPEETLPPPAGFPAIPGMPALTVGRGQLLRGPGVIYGHALSMSDLTKELQQPAGRIVVDKTGLSDVFDVNLKFASNIAPSTTATPPVRPQSIPPLPGAPQLTPALQEASLEDALKDQLGLKLESVRMPIEVLIIQSVERPSEN